MTSYQKSAPGHIPRPKFDVSSAKAVDQVDQADPQFRIIVLKTCTKTPYVCRNMASKQKTTYLKGCKKPNACTLPFN